MICIDQAPVLANKKVLVRVDFNVPLDETGHITDDRRIRESLPTISYLISNGAIPILVSHLGRPGNKTVPDFTKTDLADLAKFSLKPVQLHLANLLQKQVHFANGCIGPSVTEMAANLKAGEIMLLENVRFYPEEEKNDPAFAQSLASLADVYCNDAFGTAHRAHASTAGVANFFKKEQKYAGFLMMREVTNGLRMLQGAAHPVVLIIGGAKVSDKLPIIQNLLPKIDTLIIGGGMAYTFILAQGGTIGASRCETAMIDAAKEILNMAAQNGVRVYLPPDAVIAGEISADTPTEITFSDQIPAGKMGLDIGPAAINLFKEALADAATVFWNGPMGVFEIPAFAKGTFAIAETLAAITANQNTYTMVGGGDSAAAIEQSGLADRVSFVSTGGGALLELLEGKILPGVAALS